MSEGIVVALISAVALVLVALLGLLARVSIKVTRVGRDAAEAKIQTANDHDTNLRVELDERHAETRSWFKRLERSVGGIRDDAREDRKRLDQLAERVDHLFDLEITHPRHPERKTP